MNEKKLTHFNESGEAHMVDVHEKADTYRVAKAEGTIFVNEDAFAAISQGTAKKGDVLGIARIAGIMGAKNNASLIPLCHPIAMTKCDVDFELNEEKKEHKSCLHNGLLRKDRCGDGSTERSEHCTADHLRYVQSTGSGHGDHGYSSAGKGWRKERTL